MPAILDILAIHGIFTTFFVLAPWAEANALSVQAIEAAGHEIANHSYAHERMAEWDPDRIVDDLTQAEDALMGVGVSSTKPWFRPGFGNRSVASVDAAFGAGRTTVRWTNGSNDFVEGTQDEIQDSICADLLEGAQPRAILISHTFNPQTPAAVDRFIRGMHDQGYVFAPLSVLVAPDPGLFLTASAPE